MKFTYVGQTRSGSTVTGQGEGSVVEFVTRRHRRGWRTLTVESDGVTVGAIEVRNVGRAKRVWWANNDGPSRAAEARA